MKGADLRVHSSSGVFTLMWILSIQMWPLAPSKNPSITTCVMKYEHIENRKCHHDICQATKTKQTNVYK